MILKQLLASSPAQTNGGNMNWITIKKCSEFYGYSEDAIRAKIKKGQWMIDQQFTKAPDGRILISINEVNKWITS
jgi:hypothetical protein